MRCDALVWFLHYLVKHWFQEDELRTLDNSAQIFNSLSDVPGDVQDVDELIDVSLISVIFIFILCMHYWRWDDSFSLLAHFSVINQQSNCDRFVCLLSLACLSGYSYSLQKTVGSHISNRDFMKCYENINELMIKVFIVHKILFVEIILSTYMPTQTRMHACTCARMHKAHTHTHTHTHSSILTIQNSIYTQTDKNNNTYLRKKREVNRYGHN